MLEQGTRVMSAVHKRLHYAMKTEFKLLASVIHDFLPQEYPYYVSGVEPTVLAQDFDDRIDVIPVSNPNIFSQAQRIALAQSQLQLAMQAPQLHNTHEAFRRMYDALGVADVDAILKGPPEQEPQPKDPGQEHIDALDNIQLRAFEGQDHDAHIMAHLMFMASGIVQSSPVIALALQKHILEHIRLKAREQATAQVLQQSGMQEVTEDQMLQVERLVAQLIAQDMQAVRQMSQQIAGGGQAGDPLIGLKQEELNIKAQAAQADIAEGQRKLDLQQATLQERARQFDQRLASQEATTDKKIQASTEREIMRLNQKNNPGG
jgi:hypothetical protein